TGQYSSFHNLTYDVPHYYYGQGLPNNQAIETLSGGVNMTGNVLLMHMDEESATNGTTIIDTSGESNEEHHKLSYGMNCTDRYQTL
ncbi:hypothetical protein ACFLZN_00850, partial [Nanoarchaeota archaeon]